MAFHALQLSAQQVLSLRIFNATAMAQEPAAPTNISLSDHPDHQHESTDLQHRVSFLHIFQQAMTSEEATLQKEFIPLFADRDGRILHPRSEALRVWTVLMVVMVTVSAVIIPYEVCAASLQGYVATTALGGATRERRCAS